MSTADITFPTLLQDFFQRRLVSERGVSAHTIASYRDSFGLLLRYAETRTGRAASTLTVQDLDAPMILSFLDHLESERKCGARTRNLRLTAIRSFMRYVSIRDPASLPVAQRVRFNQIIVTGPPGYCVDERAIRQKEGGTFVLLGSCASLARDPELLAGQGLGPAQRRGVGDST